jgi:threonine/homoserine/homoserine lactone efflux protein
MMIVLNGLKLGIVLAFLIGPVFFTIIQTSVEKGFRNGVMVSLGVSLSDIMYVVICYFGVVQFINNPQFRYYLAYAGGGILIMFGLYHLFIKSRRKMTAALDVYNEKKMYKYFIKGFIINGMSPMVLIFWVGAISIASLDFGYHTGYEFFIFITTVLCTVLATDILKSYLADKLRNLVTHRLMVIINVVVGICLIIFGGRLIWSAGDFLIQGV